MTSNIFKVGLFFIVGFFVIQSCTGNNAPEIIKASEVQQKLEQEP